MANDMESTPRNGVVHLSRRHVLQGAAAATGAATLGVETPARGASPARAIPVVQADPAGEATIAQGPEITNLDASMSTGMLTFNTAIHMMEPLLMRGDDLQLQPFLAEEYAYVDDTTLRLKIRQGVTFHNGDPLTVDDVVFTLQRVSAPDSELDHRIYAQRVASVEAVDGQTVEVKFSEPDATFLGRLALIPIVPKRVVEEMGNEGFDASPTGTGPYTFVSWQRGDRVTLQSFPNYWRGPAAIKSLVFRGITEDATRMAELQTGALELATNVPTYMVPELETAGNVQVKQVNSLRALFVVLNTKQPPFDDVRMRQAVNFAIDKDLIVEGVLDGAARPLSQPFGPEVFGYNPNLDGFYAYDPERARALIAEAGYTDGVDVKMFGPSGRFQKGDEVAENLAAQLEEVGIRVNLNFLEYQAYLENYSRKFNPDMHMGFWSNANNTADADYNLSLNLHSAGRLPYWSDPEIDALIDKARQTIDPAQREEMYHDILRRIVEAAPWLFLYSQADIYGVASALQGWEPRPDEMIYLYGASLGG
ncbi:MAG: ABC transporter substrate-binding protein [Actinomycetota bacterium]|nr:ABC transporter substrate-binding protein [Actinomycetota bacterium]